MNLVTSYEIWKFSRTTESRLRSKTH